MESVLREITKPNYDSLIEKYPELKEFWNESDGTLDLRRQTAIHALTKAQLKNHFGLQIELSNRHLCPRLPNRLDYVLWIRGLVGFTRTHIAGLTNQVENNAKLRGLDVGTGSSCIYPLLMCSVDEHCEMYGTEISEESASLARRNVDRNMALSSRIFIVQTDERAHLLSWEGAPDFDFSMCNPPFYSSPAEMDFSRQVKVDAPYSELLASDSELFTPGGEAAFTARILGESSALGTRITWYSTLFGKKATLVDFVSQMRSKGITNYALHEISHGKTRRWCAAWSYGIRRAPNDLARLSSGHLKNLNADPTRLLVAEVPSTLTLAEICSALQSLGPQVKYILVADASKSTHVSIAVTVYENTWSRSARRKQQKRDDGPHLSYKQPQAVFSISLVNKSVMADWIVGINFVLFDSFAGMLKRRIEQLQRPSARS
jgi:23S rRNA (adenine1618-N6)-methyltransferase